MCNWILVLLQIYFGGETISTNARVNHLRSLSHILLFIMILLLFLIIYSYASLDEGGTVMKDAYATGPWSSEYLAKHINKLEILAAFNALRAFANNASNVSIHLMLDNATSVSYINRCGGTHSFKLREVALNIINIYSRPSI